MKQNDFFQDLKNDNLSALLATTLSTNDEFNEWLIEAESQLDDDVISFKIFDLQAIMDKRNALEVGFYFVLYLHGTINFSVGRVYIKLHMVLLEKFKTKNVLMLLEGSKLLFASYHTSLTKISH